MSSDQAPPRGGYGPGSDIVDFILGITFEIWEQGGVDLIHRYYAPDVEVFSLEGLIRGAQAMVDGTRATLEAFPDRLLIGENVVWSGDGVRGFYSSRALFRARGVTCPLPAPQAGLRPSPGIPRPRCLSAIRIRRLGHRGALDPGWRSCRCLRRGGRHRQACCGPRRQPLAHCRGTNCPGVDCLRPTGRARPAS